MPTIFKLRHAIPSKWISPGFRPHWSLEWFMARALHDLSDVTVHTLDRYLVTPPPKVHRMIGPADF